MISYRLKILNVAKFNDGDANRCNSAGCSQPVCASGFIANDGPTGGSRRSKSQLLIRCPEKLAISLPVKGNRHIIAVLMTADHFCADANLLCDLFLGESSAPPKLGEPRVELGSTWTRHPSPLTVGFLRDSLGGLPEVSCWVLRPVSFLVALMC
jgi:hypothetical protein